MVMTFEIKCVCVLTDQSDNQNIYYKLFILVYKVFVHNKCS